MYKKFLFFSPLLLVACITNAAEFESSWYTGFKLSSLETSAVGGQSDFGLTGTNYFVGYRFTPYFAVEYMASFATDSEKDEVASEILLEDVGAESNALGLYFTVESQGDFYGKLRLGYADAKFTYSPITYPRMTNNEMGIAYGIAGGYRLKKLRFELEYLTLPKVSNPLFRGVNHKSTMLAAGLLYEF